MIIRINYSNEANFICAFTSMHCGILADFSISFSQKFHREYAKHDVIRLEIIIKYRNIFFLIWKKPNRNVSFVVHNWANRSSNKLKTYVVKKSYSNDIWKQNSNDKNSTVAQVASISFARLCDLFVWLAGATMNTKVSNKKKIPSSLRMYSVLRISFRCVIGHFKKEVSFVTYTQNATRSHL